MKDDNRSDPRVSSSPTANFRVFSTTKKAGEIKGVPFYFIESTAPNNVDKPDPPDKLKPEINDALESLDPADAVKDIAKALIEKDDASLVVMVHGYNTPRPNVLDGYYNAIKALNRDCDALFPDDRRIVCIGYRWPSEGLGTILWSSLRALPLFPLWLLIGSVVVFVFGIAGQFPQLPWIIGYIAQRLMPFTPVAVFFTAIVLFTIALRTIVYFRDIYRATNYGVQDLVDVVRQIDLEASELVKKKKLGNRPRIALSFIGHSMGGLVVTNVIRVLSDVFDPKAIRKDLSNSPRAPSDGEPQENAPSSIGHVFSLTRFVLASPDIPAEALIAARGNFLESSLARFKEAYLFSNEGDEVLRLISTTANYFSFPTSDRTWGYRLGNLEILSEDFKTLQSDGCNRLLQTLRVGYKTLEELSQQTPSAAKGVEAARVADAFTYFDCTDYVDEGPKKKRKSYLTEAKNYKKEDRAAHISYWGHLKLLLLFLLGRINVHGGYFEGEVSQRLIYRLACLGYDATVAAYGGKAQMQAQCTQHQIRVMLSTRLGDDFEALRKQRKFMDVLQPAEDLVLTE